MGTHGYITDSTTTVLNKSAYITNQYLVAYCLIQYRLPF